MNEVRKKMNKKEADRIVTQVATIYGFLLRGLGCVAILVTTGVI